jgi:D-arabinose 5-phosphate isomerase GutQ
MNLYSSNTVVLVYIEPIHERSGGMLTEEILATARAVIEKEISSLTTLLDQLDDHFVEVAYALLNCQGHVLVAGAGTSNPVSARLAHLLTCCGTPALFIHPGDSQHGLSGAVTDRDIVILVSRGGETVEVNYLAEIAGRRGAKTIAFTEEPESTLGKLCDLALRIQPLADADALGVIATGSSLTVSAMGDALCTVLLQLRGHTKEAFAQTHPGGAMGQKLAGKTVLPQTNEE